MKISNYCVLQTDKKKVARHDTDCVKRVFQYMSCDQKKNKTACCHHTCLRNKKRFTVREEPKKRGKYKNTWTEMIGKYYLFSQSYMINNRKREARNIPYCRIKNPKIEIKYFVLPIPDN